MENELSKREKWDIRELLGSEIMRIVMICGLIWTGFTQIVMPIKDIQGRITVIESNHLTHIQASISEIEKKNKEQDDKIDGMCIKVEKFISFMEAKFGK